MDDIVVGSHADRRFLIGGLSNVTTITRFAPVCSVAAAAVIAYA
jgi:hypothetical protein